MPQDSALVKRGLLLLAVMSALVAVLLIVLLERPGGSVPQSNRDELLVGNVMAPVASFPGSVCWANVFQASAALPSSPGWEIRYNAVRTFALRGSDLIPWDVFLEMLDERRQMCNYRVELYDGKVVSDETAARQNMLIALRALAEWHKKRAAKQEVSADLLRVYAAVDRLAEHPILEIQAQADRTRKTFFR